MGMKTFSPLHDALGHLLELTAVSLGAAVEVVTWVKGGLGLGTGDDLLQMAEPGPMLMKDDETNINLPELKSRG